MYTWLIFLHVLSAFGFLFTHGASAAVMLKVRAERDPARIQALLDLSNAVGSAMTISALLLFLSGLSAAFLGSWWDQGWIWLSLGLFLAISLLMSREGRLHFGRLRGVLGAQAGDRKQVGAPAPAQPPESLEAVLASGRVWLLAIVGLGGLAVITWLMMFKPF